MVETFKDIIPLTFGERMQHHMVLLHLHYLFFHMQQCIVLTMVAIRVNCVSVYVISIFMMFISSTIYHSMQNNTSHKYILRIIDHSMIYVAISGTYTPVLLSVVGGWLG